MRALAKTILTTAATASGMNADSVMDEPEKQTILLPVPRLELQYLTEDIRRDYQRILTYPHPETPETHRVGRFRLYTGELLVRAVARSDDENILSSFVREFIVNVPRKIADDAGNLVTIEINKAVRGGFGSRTVEVFKKRSNAVYIHFEGMICKDVEEVLITEVDVKSGVTFT